jgi:predicted component of type VI protein secretion system
MNIKLLVVQGRPQGKSLLFPPGEFLVGRGAECHLRPDSEWVSRQHCLLRVTGAGIAVRDLGSRNGTLVNGVRVLGERALAHGDQVQVGPLVFEVQLEEGAKSAAGIGVIVPPAAQDTANVQCLETEEMINLDGETLPTQPPPPPDPAQPPPQS